MLQTAHGSLTIGLDIRAGQSLLIRGGTSSVGMAAATKREALASIGVDHVLIDDGGLAAAVRRIVPGESRSSSTPYAWPCLAGGTLRLPYLSIRCHRR
jgi:NADPH:quinone reductase-like Zn-dependent oxidoreductase